MATIRPVAGKMAQAVRLAKAVGITQPIERLVIEIDVNKPIRLYVKYPADIKVVDELSEIFESIQVDSVEVEDDSEIVYVKSP